MPNALFNDDCISAMVTALMSLGVMERDRTYLDGDITIESFAGWQSNLFKMLNGCRTDQDNVPIISVAEFMGMMGQGEYRVARDFVLSAARKMTEAGDRGWTPEEIQQSIPMPAQALLDLSALTTGAAQGIMRRSAMEGVELDIPPDLGRWTKELVRG